MDRIKTDFLKLEDMGNFQTFQMLEDMDIY